MRFGRSTILAVVTAALASCGPAVVPGGPGTDGLPSRFQSAVVPDAADMRLFDEAVLVYVNRERAGAGLPPLRSDPRLARAATDHAANMAYFRTHSHRLPVEGAGRLVQRMDRQGVRYRTAGENIGMEKLYRLVGRPVSTSANGCSFTYADTREPVPVHSYDTLARSAVARWMASPKHRASILRRDFTRTGSAFGVDTGGPACGDVYLVQTFAD